MRTWPKAHLTPLISLIIFAASAVPIGAADPDVYMNTVAPPSATCPVPPSPGTPGDVAVDPHAVSAADADVYLRGECGGVIGSAADVARILEVLADALASLLH